MKILTPIDEVDKQEREMYGGKAISLAIMVSHGINIPPTYVLSGEIYRKYIEETGLDSRIGLILAKKPLKSMRWEEVWDISMEIRNLFLRTKIPVSTKGLLEDELSRAFKKNGSMIAVRSSSAFEDSAEHSFAGLHESFIGISLMPTVTESLIFKKIRLVWASLWSSNALIYRNELKLDVESANMAVIVQKTIHGSSSGLLFCKDPMGKNHMIMEAVYGLNEALVDGSLEP